MTTQEIKSANPAGTFSMDYSNEIHSVVFSNGVRFNCESLKEATKLYKKLEKMEYTRSFNFQSDEFDGMCQANQLGLEFPKATCICSNPAYNF